MYGEGTLTDYGATVSYGILRREFDSFLLRNNSGPTMLGEAARSMERTAQGWLVNGRIRARLVVGAGGHNCPVARVLGAKPGREPAIVALVAEFEPGEEQLASGRLSAGQMALYFDRDGRGYGWLLRKGLFLNLGLVSPGGQDLRRRLADFCRHLDERGEPAGDLGGLFRGHAYLPYRNRGGRRIVGDRALLIGDAAGLAFPRSGKGMLPAVESAIMASQTILCASGDYRPAWLQPYADAVAERFGGRGGAGLGLPAGLAGVGARVLLAGGRHARQQLLDRWFLRQGERPLVPRAEEG